MAKIDDHTAWGTVKGIVCKDGERYYFIVDKDSVVSLLPADVLEDDEGWGRATRLMFEDHLKDHEG